jgi:hypothetical protein
MVTGIGSARARGMALSELAALQRGLMLSDPFIASVTFPGAEALVVLGGPGEQRRAQLGLLSASRDDWHRALAASGNLAPPVEGRPPACPPTRPPRPAPSTRKCSMTWASTPRGCPIAVAS